ncbi:MAG: putative sugar O-methyltransferase [Planctomycetota bacterium]
MTTVGSMIDLPSLGDPEAALDHGLAPCQESVDEGLHAEACERAAEMYRRCLAERDSVPTVFRPGGEWDRYIAERSTLYEAIRSGDKTRVSDMLRSFWRNELGTIVKEYATFEQLSDREQPRAGRFMEMLPRNYAIWREIVRADPSALDIPAVGEPWGMEIDGRLVAPKATRYHALATQCAELVRGRDGERIAEVGAGYGGMAYFLLRDHPEFSYADYDLPETLVIAAYALICSLPGQRVTLYGEKDAAGVVGRPGATLLPNYAIADAPPRCFDLTVNTFSFSEMPAPTLSRTLDEVTRSTRGFLLHHNMDRPGVVNRGAERIPASTFPIFPSDWRLLHRGFDLFHGAEGDYREYLYQRLPGAKG